MTEYIKREDAVKAAFDCTDSLEPPIVDTTVKLVAMKIQDIPPEDVRSIVHGKWIPRILPLNHAGNECSVCLAISVGSMKTKYCPNCGAKMDLLN